MAFGVTVDFNANVAKFSGQVDKITADLSKFEQRAQSVGSSVKTVFAALGVSAAAAGFSAFVREGIDTADMLSKLADKTGVAVEELAGLKLAADLSDTSIEATGRAINKLSIYMGQNAEAARELGLSAKDPVDAFLQFSDIFSGIADDQQRAAVGAKVLGKSYADLAPLLLQGSGAIREQIASGKEYLPITTAMAKQSADFNDNLTKLTSSLSKYSIEIGGPIVENINAFINTLQFAQREIENLGGGVSGALSFVFEGSQLSQLTKDIDQVQRKIAAMNANGAIGGLIDDIFGNDINLEKNKLESLLKQRTVLLDKFRKDQESQAVQSKPVTAQENIDSFLSGDGVKNSEQERNKSATEAARLFESTRTPLEKYNLELKNYKELLQSGVINQDTFARATLAASSAMLGQSGAVQELSSAEAFRLDQQRKSLELAAEQARIDASNPLLQARLRTEGKTNDPRYNPESDTFNFNKDAPNVADSLQQAFTQQPPIELPKFNEEIVLNNLSVLNSKMRDYLNENPITQIINLIVDSSSAESAGIDMAALTGGTR